MKRFWYKDTYSTVGGKLNIEQVNTFCSKIHILGFYIRGIKDKSTFHPSSYLTFKSIDPLTNTIVYYEAERDYLNTGLKNEYYFTYAYKYLKDALMLEKPVRYMGMDQVLAYCARNCVCEIYSLVKGKEEKHFRKGMIYEIMKMYINTVKDIRVDKR